MQKYVLISTKEALNYWQGINPRVELTEERLAHIRMHHPNDFELCVKYIDPVIEDPDLVLEDHKNPLTAMFIRSFEKTGVNVVIKLALSNQVGDRSFIVTIHPVGARSIQKLQKKNKVVYRKPSDML